MLQRDTGHLPILRFVQCQAQQLHKLPNRSFVKLAWALSAQRYQRTPTDASIR
jgi:hypothetical protein